MKKWIIAAALIAMSPMPAFAQTSYSTANTEIGTLLDDPSAKAILDKHVPGMTNNDQVDMARAMTLKDIQQYSPDEITDKILAEIDADFAKLGVKK